VSTVVSFLVGVLVGLAGLGIVVLSRRAGTARTRRDLGTEAEQVTYETLHTAWSAAPPLRAGLSQDTARKAARHLRGLLRAPALAITDGEHRLAWDGTADQHADAAVALAATAFRTGKVSVLGPDRVACADPSCTLRYAVAAPIAVEGEVQAVLTAYSAEESAGLARAAAEVARWASGQLELAELDRSKARLIEAEVRALRAQISPHFIYNSLTAIASFVRTDPARARNLLLEFADFTRYSFRRHGEFTTLAEELNSIDQYLNLERARFGERLSVTLQISPEVLPVAVPFLCLQPLVENAVQHGMEDRADGCHITILAQDGGSEALISVEDDGAGMDPEACRRMLSGKGDAGGGIALGNIDERLRQVYGHEYGLVVETALGAGTKVKLRVPKHRVGVHAT